MQQEAIQINHDHDRSGAQRGAVWWGLGSVVIILAVWLAFWWQTRIQLEDALITYRYAANLAQGEGFVFNHGERVLGTSTPLLTLLLALGGMLFGVGHIPLISTILGLTAGVVAAVALHRLLRVAGVGPRWTAVTVLAAYLHPVIVWTTTGGMETPLVLCFMSLSLLSAVRSRWSAAATWCALLVLTRPDGAIWAGLIVLVAIIGAARAGGGRALRPLLAFGVPVAVWAGFATVYFGSPIPHSLTAKRALELVYSAERAPLEELHAYGDWFLKNLWLPHSYGHILIRHQVWAWLALLVMGALGIARRAQCASPDGTATDMTADSESPPAWSALMVLPVFIVAFCAAFYLGSAPRFPWYASPLIWASVTLGMLGLWELWVLFSLYWREFNLSRWGLAALGSLVAVGLGLSLANRGLVMYRQQRDNQMNENGLRRALGEWLAERAAPDDVIATEAIGYQGYYSGRRLVDLAGLISPEVVTIMRGSKSHAETFHRVLKEIEPKFVVLRSFEVRDNRHFHGGMLFDSREQEQYFRTHYGVVHEMTAPKPDADFWKDMAGLTVYQRRQQVPISPEPAAAED